MLRGGRVVTVDEALPEAEAMAIRGDRILFVGSDAEVEAYTGPETEVIDLAGRLAIPGFIEGHGHLMGLGQSRLQLDLMATTSYQDLIDLVAEAVAGRAARRVDRRARMAPEQMGSGARSVPCAASRPTTPCRRCLPTTRFSSGTPPGTPASPMRRPWSWREVTAATPDPDGGEIIRDEAGQPTGIFVETASGLVASAYSASRETA